MTITLDSAIRLTLTVRQETQCTPLFIFWGAFIVWNSHILPYQPQLFNVMPFLAEEHIEVSTTDLLSWMFDKQNYDSNKPVSMMALTQSRSS